MDAAAKVKKTKPLSPFKRQELFREALVALWECAAQAKHDFCGEQRDWHLPRINKVAANLMRLYPLESVEAIEAARTPYGTPIG